MTTSIKEIAEAFSGHRFAEAYPHLAPSVRWVSVGESAIEGREAVIGACEDSTAELAQVTTEFTRFVSVVDTNSVAIDAIGRYVDAEGQTSVVSSCDIYEFDQGVLITITSYAVELPPN
jgi:hypothetical protein